MIVDRDYNDAELVKIMTDDFGREQANMAGLFSLWIHYTCNMYRTLMQSEALAPVYVAVPNGYCQLLNYETDSNMVEMLASVNIHVFDYFASGAGQYVYATSQELAEIWALESDDCGIMLAELGCDDDVLRGLFY